MIASTMSWSRQQAHIWLIAAALGQLAGCALMSRGDTLHVRYFTLDDPAPHSADGPPSQLALRLGRVDASAALNEQIAYRKAAHELSFRDDQRWTERPAHYVRRELERALFKERGLERSYSGATPSLEVELTELELVEAGAQPRARVQLIAQLREERRGLCQDSFRTELPIAAASARADMERSVTALSSALHKTVEEVAARAVQCLAQRDARLAARASAAREQGPQGATAACVAEAR